MHIGKSDDTTIISMEDKVYFRTNINIKVLKHMCAM